LKNYDLQGGDITGTIHANNGRNLNSHFKQEKNLHKYITKIIHFIITLLKIAYNKILAKLSL